MVRETCILPSLEKPYTYILQPMHKNSLTYVFYHTLYIILKNMRLTHGARNMHFTIPWKALYLHITTHALK